MRFGVDVLRVAKILLRNRIWFAGAALTMMATACSTSVEIQSANASGDGMNLGLSLNSCNRTYNVTVEEADGVMVHVVDSRRQSPIRLGGEDCADRVAISLTEPLGDRPLIDASNSNEVKVTYEPWNQQRFSEDEYRVALDVTAECIVEADPTISAYVAESAEGPYLVANMPELGDGESNTINAEYHCSIEHLDPLRR